METEIGKAREGWALPEEGTDCRGAEGDISSGEVAKMLGCGPLQTTGCWCLPSISQPGLDAQLFSAVAGSTRPHACFSHAFTWRGGGGTGRPGSGSAHLAEPRALAGRVAA